MQSHYNRPARDSHLNLELLKMGSPAAAGQDSHLHLPRSRRPIRCAICKLVANRLLAMGHWFELRAKAYG